MKILVSYVAIEFCLLLVVSCSSTYSEEIVPCDNQNIEIIKSIAQKHGYDNIQIDYEGQRFTALTKEEIECYEGYFKELNKLNGSTFKVNKRLDVIK